MLLKVDARNITTDQNYPSLKLTEIENLLIPLPPLSVQQEIVAEIEDYQKLIDGCKQVIESWKPDLEGYLEEELKAYLETHPEEKDNLKDGWPMVKLGEVCEIKSGGTPSRLVKEYWGGNIPWVGSTVCKDKEIYESEEFITELGLNNSSAKIFEVNTTLIALVGATIGKTGLLKFKSATNQNIAGLYPKNFENLNSIYLFFVSQTLYNEFKRLGDFKMANLKFVKSRTIPLPPLSVQERIVARIEAERKIIDGCNELIKTYEEKIKRVIDSVWGE